MRPNRLGLGWEKEAVDKGEMVNQEVGEKTKASEFAKLKNEMENIGNEKDPGKIVGDKGGAHRFQQKRSSEEVGRVDGAIGKIVEDPRVEERPRHLKKKNTLYEDFMWVLKKEGKEKGGIIEEVKK